MPNSVAVVVLGDVGRSPRMQYHCTSVASLPDTEVSLVGFRGERCIDAVETNPRIHQHLLSTPFAKVNRKLFLLYAPLKVLFQLLQLFWILLVQIPKPSAILVQNPPSIPALLAVWIACRLRGARMVIDWHNFGYTVLGLSLGNNHPLVRISRMYERWMAGRADAHLCVTRAMAAWLDREWRVTATVLYDKPPPFFRPTTPQEQHALFARLDSQLNVQLSELHTGSRSGKGAGASATSVASSVVPETLFTRRLANGDIVLREDRPALLVSSTSWTEDEDFGILLNALVTLDAVASAPSAAASFPDIVVAVTGKGPQRAMYEQRIAQLALKRVHIRTMWLAAGDYPLLLGSATLGVCLHFSTSGLDLPMKVVDMFGAGLPVCAIKYSCLHELVKDGVNGLVFSSAEQLALQLQSLLSGYPTGQPAAGKLDKLRQGVKAFQSNRWADNWTANAAPLFRKP